MATPVEKVESEVERQRSDHYKRKQEWKNLPGNRYTPEELREMLADLPRLTIHHRRTKVMYLK